MTNQRCGNWYFVYTGEESIHVGHFFNPGKMDLHSVRLRQRITDFEEITEIQRVSNNEEEVEEEDEDLDSSSDEDASDSEREDDPVPTDTEEPWAEWRSCY